MPATTITQSILAKFVASGNTDFSGSQGLWFGQIPANLALPFFGFVHNGETPKCTMEREYFDTGTFTFSVYAEGIAETERLALLVLAVFDVYVKNSRGMDFTGGKVIEWSRTRYTISIEPVEDVNAKKVGRADFQYAYRTQKMLPA